MAQGAVTLGPAAEEAVAAEAPFFVSVVAASAVHKRRRVRPRRLPPEEEVPLPLLLPRLVLRRGPLPLLEPSQDFRDELGRVQQSAVVRLPSR